MRIPSEDLRSFRDRRDGLILPEKNSIELAELIGILAGDGHVSKRNENRIDICCNLSDEKEYAVYIQKLCKLVFNSNFHLSIKKESNVISVRKKSQGIVLFLMSIGYAKENCIIAVPDWIWRDKEFTVALIRGLFDTDGCLCLKRNHGRFKWYPVVNITLKDWQLIEKIVRWANEKGIPASKIKQSYLDSRTGKTYVKFGLQVSGYRNVGKWIDLIGTSNPKNQKKMGFSESFWSFLGSVSVLCAFCSTRLIDDNMHYDSLNHVSSMLSTMCFLSGTEIAI